MGSNAYKLNQSKIALVAIILKMLDPDLFQSGVLNVANLKC